VHALLNYRIKFSRVEKLGIICFGKWSISTMLSGKTLDGRRENPGCWVIRPISMFTDIDSRFILEDFFSKMKIISPQSWQ